MTVGRHNLSRRALLGAGVAAAAVVATGTGAAPAEPEQTATDGSCEPPAPRSPRIDIVCGECGGSNVSRDAWADWSVEEQDWVLGAVFDYGHCQDCDGESSLEEVELPPQLSPTG